MHDNGIEELITKLYDMVQDARSLPLGADKCIVERDKVLDMLDEISNQLPGELKQAKTDLETLELNYQKPRPSGRPRGWSVRPRPRPSSWSPRKPPIKKPRPMQRK